MMPFPVERYTKNGGRLPVVFSLSLGNHTRVYPLDLAGFTKRRRAQILRCRANCAKRKEQSVGVCGFRPRGLKKQLGNFRMSFLQRANAVRRVASVGVGFTRQSDL